MDIHPDLPTLPAKFKMVERIQSVEFKNKLIVTIDSIHQQMSNHAILEPSDKTKRLVDGFFKYLTTSCVNSKTINTRMIWLAKYAAIVEHHLMTNYQGLTKDDVPVVEDDHLMTKVTHLVETVSTYRTSLERPVAIDDVISSTLHQLITSGGLITPALDSTRYMVIVQEIDMVTNAISQFHHNGAVTDEQRAPWIVMALSDIRTMMIQYIVRHKALSRGG